MYCTVGELSINLLYMRHIIDRVKNGILKKPCLISVSTIQYVGHGCTLLDNIHVYALMCVYYLTFAHCVPG